MKLTDREMKMLKASKSETEWNAACDEIKKARNGEHPPDWFVRVLATGLIADVLGPRD